MKFNPDRALGLVSRFSTLRLVGTEEEREAADHVAEEFRKSGLTVCRGDREVVVAYEPSALEVWLTGGLAIASGVILQDLSGARPGPASPWVLAATFAGLAIVALVLRLASRGFQIGRRINSPFVVARPGSGPNEPGSASSTARVVFTTHLDTRPTIVSYRFRRDLAMLDWLWLGALWFPCLFVGGWAWLATAGPALLIGLGLIRLVHRLDPWIQQKEPYNADNRTGLATLVELARSWPRDDRRSLDVRFVAVGASADNDILNELLGPSTGASTLVIDLEAPGVGDVLYLSGRGEVLRSAEQAARDLWLPARSRRWPETPHLHRWSASSRLEDLSLMGDLDASRIEPNLLTATAQIATELAHALVEA